MTLSPVQIAFLKQHRCFVACSGGVDSVVLVHLLLKEGIRPTLVHVNYKLRGAASDGDEQFVQQLAKQHGLECRTQVSDLGHLKQEAGNIQAEAREARYALFREVVHENAQNLILLGQHKDDQIETFYLNLARHAGIRGLACMPEYRDGIYRPLLAFSKDEIRAYATANHITWREDQSNATNDYARNKLRNVILPELETALPTLKASVLTLIAQFQENLSDSEARVAALLSDILDSGFIPNTSLKSCSETEVLLLFEAMGFTPAQVRELLSLQRKGAFVGAGENAHDIAAIYKGIGGFELAFKTLPPLPQLVIEEVHALPEAFTKTEVYLDADKVQGELQLRRLQTGDRMRLVGMQGSKLLSDILNDHKAGIRTKQSALVLTDNAHILWFPGYAVAPDAVATTRSIRILRLSLKP